MKFINSVEFELDKENIQHISFHYTAATDTHSQFDQRLADFQLDYLIHKSDWLSDEEAKQMMKSLETQKAGV